MNPIHEDTYVNSFWNDTHVRASLLDNYFLVAYEVRSV